MSVDLEKVKEFVEDCRADTSEHSALGKTRWPLCEALGKIEALVAEVEGLRTGVGNLLARINRDGGHKQAEIGDDVEAMRAAEDVVVGYLVVADEVEDLRALVDHRESVLEMLTGDHWRKY
jgi:hypothetical protein